MAKVTLSDVQNLQNESSAVGTLNRNFQAIQSVIETLLSRDGAVPNEMLAILDMNNRRIINLPPPVFAQEPARHGDIQTYVDQARNWALWSEDRADWSEEQADRSEEQADRSEELLHEFQNNYLGALPVDPDVDENGSVPPEGAIYFNTGDNTWRVFVHLSVLVVEDYVWSQAEFVEIHKWEALPVTTLRSMADVAATFIQHGEFLVWNAVNQDFIPLTLLAEHIPYDGGVDLVANNVQDAIDELVAKTSLAVYDISFWASGLMETNERLFRLIASRRFVIPHNLPGSVAAARAAPNADTSISLRKNGVEFGTVFFAQGVSTGVLTSTGVSVFNIGDVLEIVAPEPADTLLRDTAITLACRR